MDPSPDDSFFGSLVNYPSNPGKLSLGFVRVRVECVEEVENHLGHPVSHGDESGEISVLVFSYFWIPRIKLFMQRSLSTYAACCNGLAEIMLHGSSDSGGISRSIKSHAATSLVDTFL